MTRRGILLLAMLMSGAGRVGADVQAVTIGVLSHRGDATTHEAWDATAQYLTRHVPGARFAMRPLGFEEVEGAVLRREVDFVLVNPGIYVYLEVVHGVSRIATLQVRGAADSYNVFGGVIIARAERTDLNDLRDLRGQRVQAVSETSLGGYQMVLRELKAAGFDPLTHFGSIGFGGTHDEVVQAVHEGRADAGLVRSGIIESLVARGAYAADDFRIVASRSDHDLPLLHSTRLYPEWPFAKAHHTDNALAQRVAIALLEMAPGDPAAQAGGYAGWTVPLDYQAVHGLLQELRLPPYDHAGRFTLADVVREYWRGILATAVMVVLLGLLTARVSWLNRELARAKRGLEIQHALILDAVAEGIAGVDLEGRTTFVNRAFVRITGWSPDEVIGRNQHDLLHHTRADGTLHLRIECPVYAAFHDGQEHFVEEDVFWRRDGSSFPVEYTSAPIRSEHDGIVGAVVVFRDIAGRRERAEDERRRQGELAHAARLSTLGEMASGIAHEINQPLSAIANYAAACIRMLDGAGCDPARLRTGMERVMDQAQRAGDIIRHMRRLVRKDPPVRQRYDLVLLVREVLQLMRSELRARAVRVEFEAAAADNALVADIEPIQIEQVLLNLVRNALDAMEPVAPERRLLRLHVRREGERAVLDVEDRGVGLAEGVDERVFDPFYTTKNTGMGLGLSISQAIIESHGGTLAALRNPGAGCTFRIDLPLGEGLP